MPKDNGKPGFFHRTISMQTTLHITLSSSASQGVSLDINTKKPLAFGSYGGVYPAVLSYITPQGKQKKVDCVVKIYHGEKGFASGADERETNVLITRAIQDRSSAEAGLLRVITIFSKEDAQNNVTEYLVMPKCQAILSSYIGALQELKEQKPEVFAHVVFQVFSSLETGLETLKNTGLSHGDIKPANIGFRSGADGLLHACYLDFGTVRTVAKLNEELAAGRPTFRGTPAYSAPEAVTGDKHAASFSIAEDEFSLGVSMLELLGQKPSELHGLLNLDNSMAILFARGTKYQELRTGKVSDQSPVLVEAANSSLEHPAVAAIRALSNQMASILPEDRPKIEDIRKTMSDIAGQLPVLSEEQRAEVDDFFRQPLSAAERAYSADYASSVRTYEQATSDMGRQVTEGDLGLDVDADEPSGSSLK